MIGALLYLVFSVILVWWLARAADPDRSRAIVGVLALAFLVRFLLALFFATVPATRIFHEDATGPEQLGPTIASYWWHEAPDPGFHLGDYGSRQGYSYLAAAFCFVFGRHPAVPSLGNVLVGVATAALVYRLAKTLHGPETARRALLLVSFFPSFVLWSAVATKEAVVIGLVVAAVLGATEAIEGRHPLFWLLALVSIALLVPVRAYVALLLCFAIVSRSAVDARASLRRNVGLQATLLGGLALVTLLFLPYFAVDADPRLNAAIAAERSSHLIPLAWIQDLRASLSAGQTAGYADEFTLSNPWLWPLTIPLAVAYLLYTPFPWHLGSLRSWLAVPETLVWLALAPALYRGLKDAVRRDFARANTLLVFACTLTFVYAIYQTNVGTAYRQKTSITVLLLILVAHAQVEGRRRADATDGADGHPDDVRKTARATTEPAVYSDALASSVPPVPEMAPLLAPEPS